jgi:hypothetical protein
MIRPIRKSLEIWRDMKKIQESSNISLVLIAMQTLLKCPNP